jgi:two-component system, NarL family, nitrate/nitrite response regulator NarL
MHMSTSREPIRIVIADDHAIFRDGLKKLLAGQPEFQVVGEAKDGKEALSLTGQLKPDVLLLDMRMPKTNGLQVLQELADSKSPVRTIMLSGVAEGEDITQAFSSGARGLVMKETASSVLFKSILEVMTGRYWVGGQSAANLPQTLKGYRSKANKAQPQNYGLTSREMEIIKAVASGHSNKRIAGQFSISEQTVKHHITSVFDKLGVYNRLELTLFVLHHGIVEQ